MNINVRMNKNTRTTWNTHTTKNTSTNKNIGTTWNAQSSKNNANMSNWKERSPYYHTYSLSVVVVLWSGDAQHFTKTNKILYKKTTFLKMWSFTTLAKFRPAIGSNVECGFLLVKCKKTERAEADSDEGEGMPLWRWICDLKDPTWSRTRESSLWESGQITEDCLTYQSCSRAGRHSQGLSSCCTWHSLIPQPKPTACVKKTT